MVGVSGRGGGERARATVEVRVKVGVCHLQLAAQSLHLGPVQFGALRMLHQQQRLPLVNDPLPLLPPVVPPHLVRVRLRLRLRRRLRLRLRL